jgi:hypothetical protein
MPPKTPRSTWTSDLAALEEGRPNLLTQLRGEERIEVRMKASRSTFDMRGPTRLAGAGPLDGRVRRRLYAGHLDLALKACTSR